MNYNNEYIFLSTDDEINSVRDTIQLEEGELMICVKNGENTNCDTSGSVDLRGEQYAIYIRTSKTGFWHCADSGGNIISELETSGLIPCPPASTTIIHNP